MEEFSRITRKEKKKYYDMEQKEQNKSIVLPIIRIYMHLEQAGKTTVIRLNVTNRIRITLAITPRIFSISII